MSVDKVFDNFFDIVEDDNVQAYSDFLSSNVSEGSLDSVVISELEFLIYSEAFDIVGFIILEYGNDVLYDLIIKYAVKHLSPLFIIKYAVFLKDSDILGNLSAYDLRHMYRVCLSKGLGNEYLKMLYIVGSNFPTIKRFIESLYKFKETVYEHSS